MPFGVAALGNIKNRFIPSKRLVISLIVATFFLIVALFFQTRLDMVQSFYARELDPPITLSQGELHILYPSRLSVHPENGLGLPFILSVRNIPFDTGEVEYRVRLETDQQILIKDGEGRPIGDVFLLVAGNDERSAVVDLYLQPVPFQTQNPSSSNLRVSIQDRLAQPGQMVSIDFEFFTETRAQAWVRYFLTHLLGEMALVLSVIIAAGGWLNDYVLRHQEELRAKEKWLGNFRQLERLTQSEPLEGMNFFRKLYDGRESDRIQGFILEHLEGHWKGIFDQIERVLVEINQLFYMGENHLALIAMQDLSEFLHLGEDFTSGEIPEAEKRLDECISLLSFYFDQGAQSTEILFEDVQKQAFWLWENHDLNVREIVVQCLVLARQKPENDAVLREAFCGKDGSAIHRRLLNDMRLKDLQPYAPVSSRCWPPVHLSDFPPMDSVLKTWVRQQELEVFPFAETFPVDDPYLYELQCRPAGWDEHYSLPASAVLYTQEPRDQQAVLRMLTYAWRKSDMKDVFGIQIQLPFDDLWYSTDAKAYLSVLGRRVAEEWVRLLAYYPQDFLDLPKTRQIDLAGFMAWAAGSREALCAHLQQARIEMPPGLSEDNKPRDSIVVANRILNQLLSEITILESLLNNEPPLSRLTGWLKLRPPGCDKIVVAATASISSFSDVSCQQLRVFLSLIDQLHTLGIYIKALPLVPDNLQQGMRTEFSSEFSALPFIPVRWTDESLEFHVNARLARAAKSVGAVKTINELLAASDFRMDKILADANGSLARFLELCNNSLLAQVSNLDE